MSYFCLSPCLVFEEENESDIVAVGSFIETLEFISNFLDVTLCLHENSLYNQPNWFKFPFSKLSKNNIIQTLGYPLLYKMIVNGKVISENLNVGLAFNGNYSIVNNNENNMILSCIQNLHQDILLFVGKPNYGADNTLNVMIDKNNFLANIIKNPYQDITGNFDSHISDNCKKRSEVFPYKDLCRDFTNEVLDSALYHIYGEAIAKRNGYSKMTYNPRWYKKNAPHYIRDDKIYIISLDDVHGTFEVFDNSTHSYHYIGEFGFNGEKITSKTSKSETHRLFG